MYFSIAAPQNVTLPDGTILSFRINAQNSALCELHVVGVDGQDVAGTHILTFNRNGTPSDTSFVPTPAQPAQPAYKTGTDATAKPMSDWEKDKAKQIEADKQANLNAPPPAATFGKPVVDSKSAV